MEERNKRGAESHRQSERDGIRNRVLREKEILRQERLENEGYKPH